MQLKIFQIDAFADKIFTGNPAAVIPLEAWLPDETLQAIAEENNLSETVYFIPKEKDFQIRWFTPTKEVKLCGHATLASAFVLFEIFAHPDKQITFQSLSGNLLVTKENGLITLDFPRQNAILCETPKGLIESLGKKPIECLKGEDIIAVYETEEEIHQIKPNFLKLSEIDTRGIIITAPSKNYDFVCRFFAPRYGILEDPVTGSAFTLLAPYWAEKLNKTIVHAKQISKRGGLVTCELKTNRILISGKASKFLEGTIEIP